MENKITQPQKIEITKIYNDVISTKGNIRRNPTKKLALIKLLEFHNFFFNTAYSKNNITCYNCVRRVMKNIKELIEKWQIKEK